MKRECSLCCPSARLLLSGRVMLAPPISRTPYTPFLPPPSPLTAISDNQSVEMPVGAHGIEMPDPDVRFYRDFFYGQGVSRAGATDANRLVWPLSPAALFFHSSSSQATDLRLGPFSCPTFLLVPPFSLSLSLSLPRPHSSSSASHQDHVTAVGRDDKRGSIIISLRREPGDHKTSGDQFRIIVRETEVRGAVAASPACPRFFAAEAESTAAVLLGQCCAALHQAPGLPLTLHPFATVLSSLVSRPALPRRADGAARVCLWQQRRVQGNHIRGGARSAPERAQLGTRRPRRGEGRAPGRRVPRKLSSCATLPGCLAWSAFLSLTFCSRMMTPTD